MPSSLPTSCALSFVFLCFLMVYSSSYFTSGLVACIDLHGRFVRSYAFNARLGWLIKFLLSSAHFIPFIICSIILSSLLALESHLSALVCSLFPPHSVVLTRILVARPICSVFGHIFQIFFLFSCVLCIIDYFSACPQ